MDAITDRARPDDQFAKDLNLSLYTTITMMGVIAAGAWTHHADSRIEVAGLAFGTSFSIAVAHAWSAMISKQSQGIRQRLTHGFRHTLEELGATITPCLVVWAFLIISYLIDADLHDSFDGSIVGLTLLLAITSGWAANRGGASNVETVMWTLGGVVVGVIVILLKVFI